MSSPIRLIHIVPQGPRTTFQIGRCQTEIILIWSSSKIIFDDRQPLPYLCVLRLISKLGRRCRSETVHVTRCLRLGRSIGRCSVSCLCGLLCLGNLVGQLTDRRLQPHVVLQHRGKLHLLVAAVEGCLFQGLTSHVHWGVVPYLVEGVSGLVRQGLIPT